MSYIKVLSLLIFIILGISLIVFIHNPDKPKYNHKESLLYTPTPGPSPISTPTEYMPKPTYNSFDVSADDAVDEVISDVNTDLLRTVSKIEGQNAIKNIVNDMSEVGNALMITYVDSDDYLGIKENLIEQNYSLDTINDFNLLSEELYKYIDKFFAGGQFATEDSLNSGYLARALIERALENNMEDVEFLELASQILQAIMLIPPNRDRFDNPEFMAKFKKRFLQDVSFFITIRNKSYTLLKKLPPSERNADLLFEARYDLAIAYGKIGEIEKSKKMFEELLDNLEVIRYVGIKRNIERCYNELLENGTVRFTPLYIGYDPKMWPPIKDALYFHRFPSFKGDRQRLKYVSCQYKRTE